MTHAPTTANNASPPRILPNQTYCERKGLGSAWGIAEAFPTKIDSLLPSHLDQEREPGEEETTVGQQSVVTMHDKVNSHVHSPQTGDQIHRTEITPKDAQSV